MAQQTEDISAPKTTYLHGKDALKLYEQTGRMVHDAEGYDSTEWDAVADGDTPPEIVRAWRRSVDGGIEYGVFLHRGDTLLVQLVKLVEIATTSGELRSGDQAQLTFQIRPPVVVKGSDMKLKLCKRGATERVSLSCCLGGPLPGRR